MSRIHDALRRAQRERQAEGFDPAHAPAATTAVRESPRGVHPPVEAPIRSFSDRVLTLARFSTAGRTVLARSYAALERLCSPEGGLRLGAAGAPVRTALVTGADVPRGAGIALALAATLVEKTKERVALLDEAGAARGLRDLFGLEGRVAGLWDLAAGADPLRCLNRTELAGLYYVPTGSSPVAGNGDLPADAARRAMEVLLDRVPFVIVHGGDVLHETGPFGLLVEAVLRVSDGVPEGVGTSLGLADRPVTVFEESR